MTNDVAAARWLLTAAAVRTRAGQLLARAERGDSAHFVVHPERMDATVQVVIDTMRENYPTLDIPFHSRWRHFESGDIDRWASLEHTPDDAERARRRFDLVIVSVLLDAGAGPTWRYRGQDGNTYTRSEGLGVASFEMFRSGTFSADPAQPWRCDAAALASLETQTLARGMQVTDDNPLAGLDGRAALLRSLGARLSADAAHFGTPGRVGHLFDHLAAQSTFGALPAPLVLETLLAALGPIWPGRHTLAGSALGDTWRHSAFTPDDIGMGLVPLHKLSQWLTYSLIEPLQDAGLQVTDLDGLTGLAEYRNGGLMLDGGLLAARDPGLAGQALEVSSEPVIEWRSLTVALLDRIADAIRVRLGMSAAQLPLARVLEGGTWAAGRRLACARQADGGPPLRIVSDGTVF